jgi:hypothetical protein
MAENRWKRADDNGVAYYLRRTDDAGQRVILELHFAIGDGHVAAAAHCYDAPDGHTSSTLDGCTVRASVPGREHYDTWLAAGRTADAAYTILAEMDVPAADAGTPAHVQRHLDDLADENARLRAQLAKLQVPQLRSGATMRRGGGTGGDDGTAGVPAAVR